MSFIGHIFAELDLPSSDGGHRHVLAYLNR
jgi:hypothetical protein